MPATHQAISPFWEVGEARADAWPGKVRRTRKNPGSGSPFPEAGSAEGSSPKPRHSEGAEPGEEVRVGSQLILTRSFWGLRLGDQLLAFVSGPRGGEGCLVSPDRQLPSPQWPSYGHPPAPLRPLTSDCALLVLVELSLDKAEDKAGFAYCGLPQQDELKLTDLVPSSWSVGSCCTSPTRHGPSCCSGTSERGRGRCYAKRHLVGRGGLQLQGRNQKYWVSPETAVQ